MLVSGKCGDEEDAKGVDIDRDRYGNGSQFRMGFES